MTRKLKKGLRNILREMSGQIELKFVLCANTVLLHSCPTSPKRQGIGLLATMVYEETSYLLFVSNETRLVIIIKNWVMQYAYNKII